MTDEQVDRETKNRITDRVLQAESKQLHKRKPHKITEEIERIIKEEVDPAYDTLDGTVMIVENFDGHDYYCVACERDMMNEELAREHDQREHQ